MVGCGAPTAAHHDDHAGGFVWACCLRRLSHGIGSDSQRPFAIVIVGGLLTELFLSLVLLPVFYAWMAGPNDVLPLEEEDVTE